MSKMLDALKRLEERDQLQSETPQTAADSRPDDADISLPNSTVPIEDLVQSALDDVPTPLVRSEKEQGTPESVIPDIPVSAATAPQRPWAGDVSAEAVEETPDSTEVESEFRQVSESAVVSNQPFMPQPAEEEDAPSAWVELSDEGGSEAFVASSPKTEPLPPDEPEVEISEEPADSYSPFSRRHEEVEEIISAGDPQDDSLDPALTSGKGITEAEIENSADEPAKASPAHFPSHAEEYSKASESSFNELAAPSHSTETSRRTVEKESRDDELPQPEPSPPRIHLQLHTEEPEDVSRQYAELCHNVLNRLTRAHSSTVLLANLGVETGQAAVLKKLATMCGEAELGRILLVNAQANSDDWLIEQNLHRFSGWAELSSGSVELDDVLLTSDISGLDVILPGHRVHHHSVDGQAVRKAFYSVKDRFRFVFINGGRYDDANTAILAPLCDTTYLTLQSGLSSGRDAVKAASALRNLGARLAGCIMTHTGSDDVAGSVA